MIQLVKDYNGLATRLNRFERALAGMNPEAIAGLVAAAEATVARGTKTRVFITRFQADQLLKRALAALREAK